MRDDEKKPVSVLTVVALVLMGWVILKMSVIGFYDDQLIPQIVLPFLVALGLMFLERRRSSSS